MTDIDEISFLLGGLKSDIQGLKEDIAGIKEYHGTLGKKIDHIDTNLTNTRIKVAGIAGTTGLITGAMAQGIMEYIKAKLGGGSH